MSPLHAPDHVIAKLPVMRLLYDENDPVRDHSVLLGHKLLKLGKDVKLVLFKEYVHGFATMD
jgi:acetyl esterase/lipase